MALNKNIRPTCLVILDGVGETNKNPEFNAVKLAKMENLEKFKKENLSILIKASGYEVGLASEKDPGNSEVGHNAIGSGQFIEQGLSLINKQIETGAVFETHNFRNIISTIKQGNNVHLVILLSDGNVHSNINHLHAFLNQFKKEIGNLDNICLHPLFDGRDVSPQSAKQYFSQELLDITVTCGGRNQYVMDRYDARPFIVEKFFKQAILGDGEFCENIYEKIDEFYKNNPELTDENIPAYILKKDKEIKAGDSLVLLNYRGDRAFELSEMFEKGKFLTPQGFKKLYGINFYGITQYDCDKNLPQNFLVSPPVINNTLTEYLSSLKISQFSVTETQKFGHISYYFNGNRKRPFDEKLETYVEIASEPVSNFAQVPEMKAKEIGEKLTDALASKKYTFLKCNFSNGDMVGHTGDLNATIKSLQAVDAELAKIIKICKQEKINLIITADHGNSEIMLGGDKKPQTSHTNSPVWLTIYSPTQIKIGQDNYGLTNIAATICKLLGVKAKKEWNKSIVN